MGDTVVAVAVAVVRVALHAQTKRRTHMFSRAMTAWLEWVK